MKTVTIRELSNDYGKSYSHINNLLGRFCFSEFRTDSHFGRELLYLDTPKFRETLENLIKQKKYLPPRRF